MRKFIFRKKRKYLIAFSALMIAAAQITSLCADVETDEFGVAYVLNADGTRDYNNVPAEVNDPENETSTAVIRDTNNYNLSTDGPTDPNAGTGIPQGMSAERYAELNDNVIEWDEISDLITYRNPTYVKYFKQADASVAGMQSSYDEFRSQMRETLDEVNTVISNLHKQKIAISSEQGDTVSLNGKSMSKDAALKALQSGLDSAIKGKQQVLSSLDSTKRSLYYAGVTVSTAMNPVKYQMISAVETMVISYKTLEVNRSLVEEQVTLYEKLYNLQADMQAQNLGTSVNTATYFNQLNTAKKTLSDIDSGMATLKKNIAIQCGYNINTDLTIADLPAPDYSYPDGRDYEADKKQAVEGNSTVISAGKLSNYENSSYGMTLRDMGENEAKGKAGAKFDSIHNELLKEQLLKSSTETSLKKVEITSNSAKVKYDMGMLGLAEYEAQRMQYLSYQAAAKTNELNMHQAIENYKWALLGVMSVE